MDTTLPFDTCHHSLMPRLPMFATNHQNPSLKENLSKLKEAEQKLRENPSVKENLAKLKEAEQNFRANPSVKENLSKLKDAEKKLREDAKSKQVLCVWSCLQVCLAALVR